MIYPDDESTGILPLPISSICLEKKIRSFCNSTRIFIFNLSVLTSFHKIDEFKHVLISSPGVGRGITGSLNHMPIKSLHHQIDFGSFVNLATCSLMLPKIFLCTLPKLLICSTETLSPSKLTKTSY
jgi:hypothetical protein